MTFFNAQCISVKGFSRPHFNFFLALFSELCLVSGGTYFSTEEVFLSYSRALYGTRLLAGVSATNAALSSISMLASRGPSIYEREFEQKDVSGELEKSKQYYPKTAFLFEKALFINGVFVVLTCWYVVSHFYPCTAMNVLALLPALGIWRVYYAYVRFEAIKSFSLLVDMGRGHVAWDESAAAKTMLTSLGGAVAFSSYGYFMALPALHELGTALGWGRSETFSAFSKSMAWVAFLVSLIVSVLSESGMVYRYFTSPKQEDQSFYFLTSLDKVCLGAAYLTLFIELVGAVFAYDLSACRTIADLQGIEANTWRLRAAVLPIVFSGTWNYLVFTVAPALEFFKSRCGKKYYLSKQSFFSGLVVEQHPVEYMRPSFEVDPRQSESSEYNDFSCSA